MFLIASRAPLSIAPCPAAGDVLLFSEATTHGTLPWASDTERRTALFRFAPANSAYGRSYLEGMADMVDLTPEEKAVLQPPFNA